LIRSDETIEYRQIGMVDANGNTASHSGKHTLGRHRVVAGSGVVVSGNLLSSDAVPEEMLKAYESTTGELEERLLAAMLAGEAAGGEEGEIRSCGLAVVHDVGWRVTDIRVDWHVNPLDMAGIILKHW